MAQQRADVVHLLGLQLGFRAEQVRDGVEAGLQLVQFKTGSRSPPRIPPVKGRRPSGAAAIPAGQTLDLPGGSGDARRFRQCGDPVAEQLASGLAGLIPVHGR